jgi:hypothetical protein
MENLHETINSIESLLDRNNPKYINIHPNLKLRFVKRKLELMVNELVKRLGGKEVLDIIWPEGGICNAYINKEGAIYYIESDCEGSWEGLTDLRKYFDDKIRLFSEAHSLYKTLLQNAIYDISEGLLKFKEDRSLEKIAT